MDDRPGAGDAGIGADRKIRIDIAQFAVGPECDPAVVDAAADGKIISMAEQLGVVRSLQRNADGGGVGRRPVNGAVGRIGLERDRIVVGVEDHKLIPEGLGLTAGRHRKAVVLEA